MTNYSRSVLKSNGLRHSKNPPVRFSFSLKIVPATIAKKLPLQLRPKPLFIAFFNFSHKRPTFAFAGESGYTHSAFGEGSHTRAHTPKHGAFRMGGWYHYPRSVPHVHEHPRAGCQNGVFCRFWALTGCAHKEHREPSGQRCAYARRCPEGVAAPPGCVIFSVSVEIAACMPCAQGLSMCARRGVVSLPSARFTCC